MASIQRIVSPLTGAVSYRAQVRVKGRSSESETFPNRKEAKDWAASIETAIREGRLPLARFQHYLRLLKEADDLARRRESESRAKDNQKVKRVRAAYKRESRS